MPYYKTTIFFECNSKGWTESWYRNTELTSLQQIWTQTEPMVQLRRAMLADPAKIKAFSVSFEDEKYDADNRYVFMPGNPQVKAASPDLAVLTIFRTANSTRRKYVYVRGFDDNASMDGGIFQPGSAIFVNAATAWAGKIIQDQYGWFGKTPGVSGKVIGYTQTVDQLVDIQTSIGFFLEAQVGTEMDVTISKVNRENGSVLNGVVKVNVTGTDQCVTVKPLAVFPFVSPGFIKRQEPIFRQAANFNFQKITRRAAGRPTLLSAGREAARPRG